MHKWKKKKWNFSLFLEFVLLSVNKNELNEKEWMVLEAGDHLIESSAVT